MMRIHYLQHVPFEGLGSMQEYFKKKNAEITRTRVYETQRFPALDEFDWLIILGGPMSVNDEQTYSWLVKEKAFIQSAIKANKIILGICLGAQLIADSLNSCVMPNALKEIGWFNLENANEEKARKENAHNEKLKSISILSDVFESKITAFHWHGDTFDLPADATHLAKSTACYNQAFSINESIFGFQFHLEMTYEDAKNLIRECQNEMAIEQPFVQTEQEILNQPELFSQANDVMTHILNRICNYHQLT